MPRPNDPASVSSRARARAPVRAAPGRPVDLLRRAERERQLVEATMRCVSDLGLRDTTVGDVARVAGMAVGAISQYFDSKEALFTAALRQLAEEFQQNWLRRLAEAPPDPAARLLAFVDSYFDAGICQQRKVAVWFAFWGEVHARPQYRRVCARMDAVHDAQLEDLVARLREAAPGRGPATGPTARELAQLVAATCHGLWLYFLTASQRPSRESLRALARTQLAHLFAADATGAHGATQQAAAPAAKRLYNSGTTRARKRAARGG